MEPDSSQRRAAKGQEAADQNQQNPEHPDITSQLALLRARGRTTDLPKSLPTSIFYDSVTTNDSLQPRPLNPRWSAVNFCCDA